VIFRRLSAIYGFSPQTIAGLSLPVAMVYLNRQAIADAQRLRSPGEGSLG
jgi:hypothetical protein